MKEASLRTVKGSTPQLMNHADKLKSDPEINFSEDSFDWEINLNDNENHDDEGTLLTSLVRRTYIKHLHKSLVRNYYIWMENYGGGVELSESFIARCAAELEKKAVRASMLASLYQHYIITLIKNIKKSTDKNKLYEDLLTSFNNPLKKCDKSVQTRIRNSSQAPAKQLLPTAADSTLTPAEKVVPKVPHVTEAPAKQLLPTAADSTLTPAEKVIPRVPRVTQTPAKQLLPPVADSTLTPAKQVIPKVSHVTKAPAKQFLPTDADSTLAPAEQVTPKLLHVTEAPAKKLLPTAADSTLTPAKQVIPKVPLVTKAPAKQILPTDADSTLAPAEQIISNVADVTKSLDKQFSPTVDEISEFLDEDLLSIPLPIAVDSTLGPAKQLIPAVVDSTLANVHSTVDTSFLNVAIDSHIMDTLAESFVVTPQPVPSPNGNDPNSSASSTFFVSYLPKADTVEKRMSTKLSNASESSVEVSSSRIYDPEVNLSESRIPWAENKGFKRKKDCEAQECSLKKRKSSSGTAVQQKALEERLKKFEEIFGDTCEDVPPDPKPPDKAKIMEPSLWATFFNLITWKQEKIAQTCELNRQLQMVPPIKLRLLRTSFKQLFGPIDQVTDITPEEFTQCRRRLANMIVFSLTPYFEFGQIGSREVFKALAREITRIILNNTYAADLTYTQKIVDEVFQTGVRYRTLEDVNILCNR